MILSSSLSSLSSYLCSTLNPSQQRLTEQKNVILLLPWDTYRANLIFYNTVCLILTILTCLGMTTLMSYAVLYNHWSLFGISLGVIILLIAIAIILNFPLKNKILGSQLTNEISQDILESGKHSIDQFRSTFTNIRKNFIPKMQAWYNHLIQDAQIHITAKEKQIHELSHTLDTMVEEKRKEYALAKETHPLSPQTEALGKLIQSWEQFESTN
ncbi:hypothetical protein [Chlamydia avium]|uniref:Uncharacterized protein n=1 Tax=Chlamydia avium 10DC88 TaxID=1229831 RepID=W8JEN0_9CHLA|nr:hypothetical protein [Chlamydia avium]AHK63031.1 Uncharacterized protein M832_01620 [Chlamydia avium 10DC88]